MMLIGGAVAVRVQVFWPKIVLKKWLNLKSKDLDFGADEDEDDDGSDIDDQGWPNIPLHVHGRKPICFSWSFVAENHLSSSSFFFTLHLSFPLRLFPRELRLRRRRRSDHR